MACRSRGRRSRRVTDEPDVARDIGAAPHLAAARLQFGICRGGAGVGGRAERSGRTIKGPRRRRLIQTRTERPPATITHTTSTLWMHAVKALKLIVSMMIICTMYNMRS